MESTLRSPLSQHGSSVTLNEPHEEHHTFRNYSYFYEHYNLAINELKPVHLQKIVSVNHKKYTHICIHTLMHTNAIYICECIYINIS